MTGLAQQIEERVLILAPIGRDARAAAQSLTDIELGCTICTDIADLHERLCEGAAVAVATEEAFVRGNAQIVKQWVAEQPSWSDFPFVVLTGRASSATAHVYRLRLLERLGNVSLLERPLNAVTLASTVKAALRARYRQYEVRDHLFERDLSAAKLENLVRERTVQLEQANDKLREQIAERKQAEAALQQAQKMEVIGQMTGGWPTTSIIFSPPFWEILNLRPAEDRILASNDILTGQYRPPNGALKSRHSCLPSPAPNACRLSPLT